MLHSTPFRIRSWTLMRFRYYASSAPGRFDYVAKAYNPLDFEGKTLKKWTARKKYSGEDAKPFRMIFPPPNVTGKLHLGHALTVAIQDAIVRVKLMRGDRVEWIPGFDHAGIATHSVVTRKLVASGDAVDPDNLYSELEKHAFRNRENIKSQLIALGALLDWDKEYYTLDENHHYIVREAFMHLFDTGIIRRGEGLVNWSCALESSIADMEVEEVECRGKTNLNVPGYASGIDFGVLYYCAYKIRNSDAKLIVATSRPETMFGDQAIAMNPADSKHQEFIGQSVINPLNGQAIPVIADSRVKLGFGTGLVKITPAHDKLDFVIGTDNNLPFVKIFRSNGTLNQNCGEFQDLPRFLARKKVVEFLKNSGALTEMIEYNGTVGVCSRTQDIVEPMLLPHWYFQTKRFSDTLVSDVNCGEFVIRPENMQNVFLNKMSLAHDWCLSRQIKWGHPIPAYYHQDYPEQWVTASSKLDAKKKLQAKHGIEILNHEEAVVQDQDVLDTWFSSALIPLAVSNWPDVDNFTEISLMETGHDILFFWVWRMAIMNLALTDRLPFHNVLLHGIVVDHYGRKMSKSKGNVIDPLHMIEGRGIRELKEEAAASLKSGELDQNEFELRMFALEEDYPKGFPACGSDALRFALLGQDIHDQDLTINVEYLENCKHFCNKLWQGMRLYLHYIERQEFPMESTSINLKNLSVLPMMDRWILSCLYNFLINYEANLRSCKFHLVTEAIRTFFYSQYCDVYLEFAKLELKKNINVQEHLQVMHYVLCMTIKLAHPFLPFVTEEIWSILTKEKSGLLVDSRQPTLEDFAPLNDTEVTEEMDKLLILIKQIRSFKFRYFSGVKESPCLTVEIHKVDMDIMQAQPYIENLCKVGLKFDILGQSSSTDSLGIMFELQGGRSCRVSCSRSDKNLLIPKLDDSQLLKLQSKLSKFKKQFENPAFQRNAPAEVKDKLRRKMDLLQTRIQEASPESSPKQPTDSSNS